MTKESLVQCKKMKADMPREALWKESQYLVMSLSYEDIMRIFTRLRSKMEEEHTLVVGFEKAINM